MSGSVNKVLLVGALGRDPEIRNTQGGTKIVHLSVATSERWKDRNSGEQREKTEWHRVVIFDDNLAGVAEKYLSKGSKVYLEGQLQTRKWQDQSGQDRFSTEVVLQKYRGALVMLGDGGQRSQPREQQQSGGGWGERRGGGGESGSLDDLDEGIPFATPWGLF